MREGPLDMRLGPDTALTAEQIVNRWPAEQIAMLFKEFGRRAGGGTVSRAPSCRAAPRSRLPPLWELAACVESVVPRTGHHPATRTFQALRIAVNQGASRR